MCKGRETPIKRSPVPPTSQATPFLLGGGAWPAGGALIGTAGSARGLLELGFSPWFRSRHRQAVIRQEGRCQGPHGSLSTWHQCDILLLQEKEASRPQHGLPGCPLAKPTGGCSCVLGVGGSAPGPTGPVPGRLPLNSHSPCPPPGRKAPTGSWPKQPWYLGNPAAPERPVNMLEGWQSALGTSCHWVLWGQGYCCPRVAFPAGATRGASERAQKSLNRRSQEGGRGKPGQLYPTQQGNEGRRLAKGPSLDSRGNKRLLQHRLLITVQSLGLSAKTPPLARKLSRSPHPI